MLKLFGDLLCGVHNDVVQAHQILHLIQSPGKIDAGEQFFRVGGRGGGRQKVSGLPPNSYVMVQYKTFGLKHYSFFEKKNLQPAKLLFDTPH